MNLWLLSAPSVSASIWIQESPSVNKIKLFGNLAHHFSCIVICFGEATFLVFLYV